MPSCKNAQMGAGTMKYSKALKSVRKEIPKPTKAHKRVNRESRSEVKRELKQWQR